MTDTFAIQWQSSLETGIRVVDAQHKQLFLLLDELNEQVNAANEYERLEEIIDALHFYSSRHFAMEEKYMVQSGYPGLEDQKSAHGKFIELFEKTKLRFRAEGVSEEFKAQLKIELAEWLRDHVMGMDQEFANHWKDWSHE